MLLKASAVLSGDDTESCLGDCESETKEAPGLTALYMRISARSHGSNNFVVLKHMCWCLISLIVE